MTTRQLMPIAVALLVIAIAAVTILTSGEALSFSSPGSNVSAGDNSPANQSQPQDYTGSGAEAYYFGPDFMCLIYTDSTIDCFGSDTHSVVSSAPSKTGFTQIDGGDTYACAYHPVDAFTYCWGSITRAPSIVTPTATLTPTPTPTNVPPGVDTPTPTPTPAVTPTPTVTPTPEPLWRGTCHIPRSGSAEYPLTLTGTWNSGCTLEDGTPYIWDEWRQKGTGAVTITASSPGDPNLTLWEIDDSKDPGDPGWVTPLDYNDDIDTDGGNYDAQIVYTLEDGKHYWVSVSPYENSTRTTFTLTYTSTVADLGWAARHTPFDQAQIQSVIQSSTAE